MSEYINESLLDASPIRKQKEESAKLVTKWEKSGLLEGMDNEWSKSGMAVLLENQSCQLISENSKTSPNAGGGVGDEEWSGVALPLVRRVFGNIVAQELVSVQPMNLPSGLVFYLDFKYGTSFGKFSSGDSIHGKTGALTHHLDVLLLSEKMDFMVLVNMDTQLVSLTQQVL